MRSYLFSALLLLAALLALPAVGASCHYCLTPEPVQPYVDHLWGLLP